MASEDGERANAQLRLGTVLLGKYRIERVLGIGGMAVVYEATHRNRQKFAIKVLHRELSINPDIRSRFLREGYVANTVEHRGAVKVLDDDLAEDGSAFLVMELLAGESLEQIWAKHTRRLPAWIVLALCDQLLDVLAAAHSRSIVHRDIKPANLFLTREGVVKVLDFGIARLRESTATHATQTGTLLGTPAFMAPEQAGGRPQDIDGRTDLWAVGATLFSLLTGATVHECDNAQQLIVQAATRPARSMAKVMPEASPRIVALVDRALAFDRTKRWPGADQMRDAVREAYLAEFSTVPAEASLALLFGSQAARDPATPPPRLGASVPIQAPLASTAEAHTSNAVASRTLPATPTSRRRWGWPAAAMLGLPALAGAMSVVWYRGPPKLPPSPSASAPAQATTATAIPAFSAPSPSASPGSPAASSSPALSTSMSTIPSGGQKRHEGHSSFKDAGTAQESTSTSANPLNMPLLP